MILSSVEIYLCDGFDLLSASWLARLWKKMDLKLVRFEKKNPVQCRYMYQPAVNVAGRNVEQGGKLSLFQICISNCLWVNTQPAAWAEKYVGVVLKQEVLSKRIWEGKWKWPLICKWNQPQCWPVCKIFWFRGSFEAHVESEESANQHKLEQAPKFSIEKSFWAALKLVFERGGWNSYTWIRAGWEEIWVCFHINILLSWPVLSVLL